jgi:RNA polymerase sigma factor (TIGR02999 family)
VTVERWTDRDITDVLRAWGEGDPEAVDRLIPLVYEQLRRVARRHLRGEATGHTLDTTGLVHEAYLRLGAQSRTRWHNRAQFYAIASRAMRRVLIDHARRHGALRRGGDGHIQVPLEQLESPGEERATVLLALDEALERLAAMDPAMARVVECRFFGGLTETETAVALGVSRRTVAREWAAARGWLWQALHDDIS